MKSLKHRMVEVRAERQRKVAIESENLERVKAELDAADIRYGTDASPNRIMIKGRANALLLVRWSGASFSYGFGVNSFDGRPYTLDELLEIIARHLV